MPSVSIALFAIKYLQGVDNAFMITNGRDRKFANNGNECTVDRGLPLSNSL